MNFEIRGIDVRLKKDAKLTVIKGQTGVGKSALALMAALYTKGKVMFQSYEMLPAYITSRALSHATGIDSRLIMARYLTDEEKEIIKEQEIGQDIIYSNCKANILDITRVADEIKPDLLIVDYLQMLETPPAPSRDAGLIDVAVDLERYAQYRGIEIILVCHSHTGGNIEGDNIIELWPRSSGNITATIANRYNGRYILADTVDLRFEGTKMKFTELSRNEIKKVAVT